MDSVNTLCSSCVLLEQGKINLVDHVSVVIDKYLDKGNNLRSYINFQTSENIIERSGKRVFSELISLQTINLEGNSTDIFEMGQSFIAQIELNFKQSVNNPEIGLCISTMKGARLHHLLSKWDKEFGKISEGNYVFKTTIEKLLVYPGEYTLTVWVRCFDSDVVDDFVESSLSFNVIKSNFIKKDINFGKVSASGGVYTEAQWDIVSKL